MNEWMHMNALWMWTFESKAQTFLGLVSFQDDDLWLCGAKTTGKELDGEKNEQPKQILKSLVVSGHLFAQIEILWFFDNCHAI